MGKLHKIISRIKKNPRSILLYINATGCLNFLSDKSVLKMIWWAKTGEKLNLENPGTFNEKLQWLKIYNHNPLLAELVDKYKVRGYIKETLDESYLIPLIDSWEKPEEIDFSKLPDQFVLKCNHNAAIGLCICRDKATLNAESVRRELKKGLGNNFYFSSREWAYKNVKRRIICEKYMEDGTGKGLRDYKFFCFGGVAKFVYISEGLENHDTASISFYDLEGEEMPFHRSDYKQFAKKPELPVNFTEMIDAANTLARSLVNRISLPFVRIDLYSIDGKTYFSEITCYPNSGYIPFTPEEWDRKIGEWIDLSLLKGKQ
ncbi:MAG: ATP-grasp fold amidoligase family protein [Eubacteriales bacterium]|nr:ATP-grasp fold amidoligase family protein [Eubacteriales bacterium]